MENQMTQTKHDQPQWKDVDRPDVMETFCDHLGSLSFDGYAVRMEFSVSRVDDPKGTRKVSGKRFPVARLVATPHLAVDLCNQLQLLVAEFERLGLLAKTSTQRTIQ
jgi:hypothetical protein